MRSCVERIAVCPVPNNPASRIGHRNDTKRGERIVERYFDTRAALLVELDARFPKQQGIEQLARGSAPAAAARLARLAAIVPLADHLHRRGRMSRLRFRAAASSC